MNHSFRKRSCSIWADKISCSLGLVFFALAWFWPHMSAQASTPPRVLVKQIIIEEANRSNVPVDLALAVAKVESDFNPLARSSVGARGVMQIMPRTARSEFGIHPDRLWDARTNIRTGVQFLKQLHTQYGGSWERALSHYNGGTLKNNTPHKYTEEYVRSVMKWRRIYGEQAAIWKITNKPQQAATQRNTLASYPYKTPPYQGPQKEEVPVPDVDIFADDSVSSQDDPPITLEVEEWYPKPQTIVLEEKWIEPETRIVEVVQTDSPRDTIIYEYEYRRPPPRPFEGWRYRPEPPRHGRFNPL